MKNLPTTLCAALFWAAAAQACTVPVFRYALERWPAEPHIITLSTNVPAEIVTPAEGHYANLWIARADAEQTSEVRATYAQFDQTWFEGDWEPGLLSRLTDSPLRRRIAHELLTGTTTSWILLEGSDASANEEVFSLLKETLDQLEQDMELPDELDYEDEEDGYAGPGGDLATMPVQVKFSLHRLRRDQPEERFLVSQMTALDPSWADDEKPLAAAVFGRGRMIAIPAGYLNAEVLDEICSFLCSACSCRVKELNPGIDLLMTADWDGALQAYPDAVPVQGIQGDPFMLGGTGTVVYVASSATASKPDEKQGHEPEQEKGSPMLRLWVITAVLLLLPLGVLMRKLKKV